MPSLSTEQKFKEDQMVVKLAAQVGRHIKRHERKGEMLPYLIHGTPAWEAKLIRDIAKTGTYELVLGVVREAAEAIKDAAVEYPSFADFDEAIEQLIPDEAVPDLTYWLASDMNLIQYVSQTLQDAKDQAWGHYTDGNKLLRDAQALWIHEIGYALLQGLRERARGER